MRLIEQLDGAGLLFERHHCLGEVQYHVRVYGPVPERPDPLASGTERIEGFLSAAPGSAFDPFDVWRRGAELVLRLEDGRTLECAVSSSGGALIPTSRLSSS